MDNFDEKAIGNKGDSFFQTESRQDVFLSKQEIEEMSHDFEETTHELEETTHELEETTHEREETTHEREESTELNQAVSKAHPVSDMMNFFMGYKPIRAKKTRTRTPKFRSDRCLKCFKNATTENDVKKEYIRLCIIRNFKKFIRQSEKKSNKSPIYHQSYNVLGKLLCDQSCKQVAMAGFKPQPSCNDTFCRTFFSQTVVVEAYQNYVDYMFDNFEFTAVCEQLHIKYVEDSRSSAEQTCQNLKEYLKFDLIKQLSYEKKSPPPRKKRKLN